MRKTFYSIIFAIIFALSLPNSTLAHPGRTASDGCHYCRTRCDYWGVPWNERHCHGGGSITSPPVALPPPPPPPPAPKIETWTFNGQTYYSYSNYLEAKAAYEVEQRQKQEEENKRLQEEIELLKNAQQPPPSNKATGSVAGIATIGGDSKNSGYVVGALAIAALLASGWYYFKKRKMPK